MMRLPVFALFAALALPLALAGERIESFDSQIVVERTGDLVVPETIRVRAEGNKIKRGIYRDIPLLQETKLGFRIKKPLEIISVTRDGSEEDYRTESIGEGGIRIYIGRESFFLKPGSYTYEVKYRTGRQLYLEEDRDVLYWNVNGTEWEFPTNEVTATVHLPSGIKGTKVQGFTGKLGEQGKDYKATLTKGGATITTTRPFRAGENLTVVLEWPPGQLDADVYEIRKPLPAEDPRSPEQPAR